MDTSLVPYPMPSGVKRLMPFQEYPFNGDGYAVAEVLRLKAKHGLTCAIETGTCLGSTALWLSDNFDFVWTYEVHAPFLAVAHKRFGDIANIESLLCDSAEGLRRTLVDFNAPFLLWADAHWNEHCPLLDELDAVAKAGMRPVIMIHDFQVPGRPDLGHDLFPDRTPFRLPAISDHLDAIYGIGGWDHHYNDKAEGAKRGILYVEPKV
jgi:hypothetical protein